MSLKRPALALPGLPSPLTLLPPAINHLLKQEAWARDKLLPHAGKTLTFVVAPFTLSLSVTTEGLVALATPDAVADVQITLPLSTLPQVLAQGTSAAMRQMKLEGDADFAQTVSYLTENLRWEVEEDLSKVVGDMAAHRIATDAKKLAAQARSAQEKITASMAEYWLEENPQLVRPRDVDTLAEQLRTLRDDVARMEKRIDRLNRNG